MTIPEIRALSGVALRIAVAEAEGWSFERHNEDPKTAQGDPVCLIRHSNIDRGHFFIGWLPHYITKQINAAGVPSFHSSRDAITEAILRRFTTEAEMFRFACELGEIVDRKEGDDYTNLMLCFFRHATASATDLSRAYLAAIQ